MFGPLLLDLSHSSHTRARTGVQRVTRSLQRTLGENAIPITHDPNQKLWRTLEDWEQANLLDNSNATKRGARWPLTAKLRGHTRRLLGRQRVSLPNNSGLLVPEVFSAATARVLPELFAQTKGPRVAVFHDAIALKLPELTPTKTVARFPAYLAELLAFDGIAAVSEDSRQSLLDYWQWLGAKTPPPVQTISLGVDVPQIRSTHQPMRSPEDVPAVLSVGSIEGRKNHLALLDACERLWADGAKFSLHLIGLAQTETGRVALARIRELQAAGRSLRYDGPVDDDALTAAYSACTFTVYPSLAEGFGLPVIESLAHGKPCICSSRGALGESARGGGCVALDRVDANALAAAIGELLNAPCRIAALASDAQQRRFKDWSTYASELTSWASDLPRRD
jgi:glycosyltransferase involved in cell wall biosynthesis